MLFRSAPLLGGLALFDVLDQRVQRQFGADRGLVGGELSLGFAVALGEAGLFPALATPALVVAWGWMLAAVVVGVRQALDYRQTSHALFVCLIGWLVAFTLTAGVGLLLTTSAH